MSSGPRQHFHWRSELHFRFAFHSVINLSAYINLTLSKFGIFFCSHVYGNNLYDMEYKTNLRKIPNCSKE